MKAIVLSIEYYVLYPNYLLKQMHYCDCAAKVADIPQTLGYDGAALGRSDSGQFQSKMEDR